MKYETFESIILELKKLYDDGVEKDRALSKIFGEDSYIVSDYKIIDNTLKILEKELDDDSEFIQWLFWESLNSRNGISSFYIHEKEYEGSIKNVWLNLKKEL